jgi:hypothetical protein
MNFDSEIAKNPLTDAISYRYCGARSINLTVVEKGKSHESLSSS